MCNCSHKDHRVIFNNQSIFHEVYANFDGFIHTKKKKSKNSQGLPYKMYGNVQHWTIFVSAGNQNRFNICVNELFEKYASELCIARNFTIVDCDSFFYGFIASMKHHSITLRCVAVIVEL